MNLKSKDIPNVQYKVPFSNLENVFNVYENNDGSYFYNLLRTVNIPENLDPEYYDLYKVQYGDMWPTLAWKFYKNVNLWWLICATNQVDNATENPKTGENIKIIKENYVNQILSALSEG